MRKTFPDIRLPNVEEDLGAPAIITEDDGGLVLTFPLGRNPGATAEMAHALFTYLRAAPVCTDPETDTFVNVHLNCPERKFVEDQIWERAKQNKKWSRISVVTYMTENAPQLLDIPGPFFINCKAIDEVLVLQVGKARE